MKSTLSSKNPIPYWICKTVLHVFLLLHVLLFIVYFHLLYFGTSLISCIIAIEVNEVDMKKKQKKKHKHTNIGIDEQNITVQPKIKKLHPSTMAEFKICQLFKNFLNSFILYTEFLNFPQP